MQRKRVFGGREFRVHTLNQAQQDVVFLLLDGTPGCLCRMGGKHGLNPQSVDPVSQSFPVDSGRLQAADHFVQATTLGIGPGTLVSPATAYPMDFFRQVDRPQV